MGKILVKSTLVTLAAVVASLLVASTVVPMLGGVVDGNAWLMCVVCPLATAWPASAYTFWQSDRLRKANAELARAHAQLAAAHCHLAEKASRDHMTGMLNRESFFAALDRSRRKSDRGVLLIIDADHFKKINDTFGHLAGDDALLDIASAIARAVRSGDIVGRIGGEEFGAILVGASEAEASAVSERIRREVEQLKFRPLKGKEVPLTVSIGGVRCLPDANVADLMRVADRRLYEAKNRGRNLVVLDKDAAAAA